MMITFVRLTTFFVTTVILPAPITSTVKVELIQEDIIMQHLMFTPWGQPILQMDGTYMLEAY